MQPAEGDVPRLFHAARALAGPQERAAYLARACGDDSALRARIEELLRADDGAGGFLEQPLTALALEEPGQTLGPYRLLQRIGEGGFGTVWMAEQREPMKRRVALKVIKLGMDTRQVVARFEAERQALALMDHPGIARVFDAGATGTGRPYFVMELVKGVPIVEYCDSARLDTRARLELFTLVCRAIQHAHQKGVIHRDVKPSNVLVTLHDGEPVPKVIDFGIAKATQGELTTRTLFTEHGQVIGTPAYMSPEQAELSGLDVDTRTDVYSLGVLLYELLTGTTPFGARAQEVHGFLEMLRAIREDEPERPSTRVAALGATAVRTAELRRVDARRLNSLLRGDLDWIVLRCLEKDRARRYESASDLAADVERHLAHEPVLARPPSRLDRLRKFARRNRLAVAAASAVGLALVAGGAATTAAWVAERARARELDDVARFQASQLASIDAARMGRRLGEDLADEFGRELRREGADPEVTARRVAELRSALAGVNLTNVALRSLDENVFTPALAAVARDFAGQPLVEARLLQTLASTLHEIGLLERALAPQVRALALRREHLGDDDSWTLLSQNALGTLLQALGRLGEAEPLLRDALARRRRQYDADDPRVLASVSNLGALLHARGADAEAEKCLREALEGRLRAAARDEREVLSAQNNLGVLLQAQNRLLEAEPLLREALEGERRLHGDEHPATLSSMNNLSSLLRDLGRLDEAERLARQALAGRRSVLGDGHVETLTALNNLATVLMQQGHLAEAEPIFRESLEGHRRALGEAHAATLTCSGNLCALLQSLGRTEEALPLLDASLEACRRVLGARHEVTLMVSNQLGVALMQSSRYEAAEPVLRELAAGCRETLGPVHPGTITSTFNLGLVLRARGLLDEADDCLSAALSATRAQPGEQSAEIASKLDALAVTRLARGRWSEAEALLRESFDLRSAQEPDGWRRYETMSLLGESLARQDRHAEAEPLLVEACERMAPPAARADRRRLAFTRLIEHYRAAGRPADAARWEARLESAAGAEGPQR